MYFLRFLQMEGLENIRSNIILCTHLPDIMVASRDFVPLQSQGTNPRHTTGKIVETFFFFFSKGSMMAF